MQMNVIIIYSLLKFFSKKIYSEFLLIFVREKYYYDILFKQKIFFIFNLILRIKILKFFFFKE